MRIHVKLEPHDRQLNEIVVRSKKKRYKRKNNPAVDLMRKVIAAKSKSDLKDNDFYRYSKYQKITFAFNNITQEFLDSNPLIASIEVKLSSQYANSDSIAKIEQFIKQENNIRELQYRKDLLDDVNRNIGRISILLLSLAAILALISFALINNTIKLTIYAKRFLIHTMKLVGASWGFIRRPFLVRNFKVGVLSAVLADGLLWCGAHWLVSYEPGLEAVVTLRVMVLVSVVVLAFGVFITWLCALLSINKFLRMKAGTLYYV